MPQDNGLKGLDKLIADLGGADMGMQTTSPFRLLLEHLQAARRDLLGSMSGEYRASLAGRKGIGRLYYRQALSDGNHRAS
jgi:hypothetical protein